MEFGAKEILIALGILVFAAIVLDVIKRIRASRYENIRMPRKRKQPVIDDGAADTYGSELPSGGARVVGYREEDEAERVKEAVQKSSHADKVALKSFQREQRETTEPGSSEQQPASEKPSREKPKPRVAKPPRPTSPQGSLPLDEEKEVNEPSLVIALHVMAEPGDYFAGEDLKVALLENGLRFGAMKIFHRHTEESGAGPVMFSVANLVKPGTFDLNAMDQFDTPGVTLFFDAGEVAEPLECFDQMLATGQHLAAELNGHLKDETRSDLTRQTIEHYRQKIADHGRARRLGAH